MILVIHPGSGSCFFLSIPEPGSRGQKRHRIPDPGVKRHRIPHPGVKKAPPDPGSRGQKGTGSRIRICNTELNTGELEQVKRMVKNISITEDDYWRYRKHVSHSQLPVCAGHEIEFTVKLSPRTKFLQIF
jgi:hypothetical protein